MLAQNAQNQILEGFCPSLQRSPKSPSYTKCGEKREAKNRQQETRKWISGYSSTWKEVEEDIDEILVSESNLITVVLVVRDHLFGPRTSPHARQIH